MFSNKLHKRIIAVLLAVFIAASFTACLNSGTEISKSLKVVEPSSPDESLHTQSAGDLKPVIKSGLYELLLDEKNVSLALKDTAEYVWYTLPLQSNTKASLVTMEVTDGETKYILNSQDNAVAFGNAKVKNLKNGVEISYIFSEKKDSPSLKIPLTLVVTLEDGLLDVRADCSKIDTGESNFKVADISIFPYFGAAFKSEKNDFILIPDGPGGLIDLSVAADAVYELDTYGADFAVSETNKHSAIMPVFGCKRSSSAFAGIVTEGDAISQIKAQTSKSSGSNVYASFDITPNSDKLIADESFSGEIGVSYKFISGSAATYSGIASMCREQLVREGMLSTRSVDVANELPLCVTLIGCLNKAFGTTSDYTTFENAEDIAGVLKSKGVNSISLKYDGALSGGLKQKTLGRAKLASKLGDKKDFEALENYMSAQGFDLYIDVNLISSASGGNKAGGVASGTVDISVPNTLKAYVGSSDNFDFEGLSANKLTSNVVSFMNNMKEYDVPGYCIDDAGSYLFSDMSHGFTDRQALADNVFDQAIALSTNKNLMVENGNLYTLKNAKIVSSIPMSTSYKVGSSYSAVPFMQMILHGTVEYSSGYLNLSEDMDNLILRSIEYGALPAFCWTYSDYVPKDTETSAVYYDNWTAEALEVYTKFNQVMGDLRDAKMTDSKCLQEGLYCTEYNGETFIYVNYNDKDVTYNNLTVKANSYLRVN